MKRRLGPGPSRICGGPIAAGGEKGSVHRIALVLILCAGASLFCIAAVYASGGSEGSAGANWPNFGWRFVNLAVLVGALYWFLGRKAREFFSGRRAGIETALAEAKTSSEAARKKFQEYAEKLDKAEGEIDRISAMIKSQGAAEKERIIVEARREALKMKDDARALMEQEFAKASQGLKIEAVRLSTQMAEEFLKKHITVKDHEAMVADTIEKVVRQH